MGFPEPRPESSFSLASGAKFLDRLQTSLGSTERRRRRWWALRATWPRSYLLTKDPERGCQRWRLGRLDFHHCLRRATKDPELSPFVQGDPWELRVRRVRHHGAARTSHWLARMRRSRAAEKTLGRLGARQLCLTPNSSFSTRPPGWPGMTGSPEAGPLHTRVLGLHPARLNRLRLNTGSRGWAAKRRRRPGRARAAKKRCPEARANGPIRVIGPRKPWTSNGSQDRSPNATPCVTRTEGDRSA